MHYVAGIDAGGTSTVALLADDTGKVCARASGAAANLVVDGELGVEKALYQVIEKLEAPAPLAAICLGMAGLKPENEELIGGVLRRLGQRERFRIVNDAAIALVAGAPEGIGVVVVSGTGSIAYGVDPHGKTARSGGWGYLLGDEGSAFWLGHAAMRAAIRAIDGRGPATSLFDRISRELDLETPQGLVKWFYAQDHSRHRLTELAGVVEEAASDGDEAANSLLDEAAAHLARAARACARQLSFPQTYPMVLSGGAYKACPSLYRRLEASLDLPRARIIRFEGEPARGAVTLALELLR